MNSRWQANRIGLINFWYYDNQEFPFVKGRMLLRGSNGSGKTVTMQSVIPLLLDGNMSPERLDPFGSRDRKMSSYLLEENDIREERTGYLFLEFKREKTQAYMTIGMGIRARKGKPLDKWYFGITDGRRVGKDFLLYKDIGEKVTLSKKELENRIGDGGIVFDRQIDYMEYVNQQIFGFETVDEYKELVDLLIQLRTPKLSKDFKPSIINEILNDSLQPLSDEDLRPMSEAIENMDNMNMNLKAYKEAKQAAEKIHLVFEKYNILLLVEKAERFLKAKKDLREAETLFSENTKRHDLLMTEIADLENEINQINVQKEVFEREKDSLSKSDAVGLKNREVYLLEEIEKLRDILENKNNMLSSKELQFRNVINQKKDEENRKYKYQLEIESILSHMETEAEQMDFQEFFFMKDELMLQLDSDYSFEMHRQQFDNCRRLISEGESILGELNVLERQKDEMLQRRDNQIRRLDALQKKISELTIILVQVENEWKEEIIKWNQNNSELKIAKDTIGGILKFADNYNKDSDFAVVRKVISEAWIENKIHIEGLIKERELEEAAVEEALNHARNQLKEWENKKEPHPERSDAVIKNRKRLDEEGIPYQEFYKVIEFSDEVDENTCNILEESLLNMGILDALIVEEKYRDKVLVPVEGCEDKYLFANEAAVDNSLLDVLYLNDEFNDIFYNNMITRILSSISFDSDGVVSVSSDGTYKLGIITGTVTHQHNAEYLGTKARERGRLAKIDECQKQITMLSESVGNIKAEIEALRERKTTLENEYFRLPDDGDMREAASYIEEEERSFELLKVENHRLDAELTSFIELYNAKKKKAIEISEKVYLTCTHVVFKKAKEAADIYDKLIVELKSAHNHLLRSVESLLSLENTIENIDEDIDGIRYDISINQRQSNKLAEERNSIINQLELTDYQSIKYRLDECIEWLKSYPSSLQNSTESKALKTQEARTIALEKVTCEEEIAILKRKVDFYCGCYEKEKGLSYVITSEDDSFDVRHVLEYYRSFVKNLDKDTVLRKLNQVYYENRGFLNNYQVTMHELFGDKDNLDNIDEYNDRRLDISARYQGVKVSFNSLLAHLDEDIGELENLIKDGDRELFEDILANTVSRKIRGKINASNMWVQKMNAQMNEMDTSSGLKLSLRWRSKTAEKEDQLDTKDLVELLKKDYRVMGDEEASRLSAHFRSKVEEARRKARDSNGMVSFYQIMKETLDYREWFEFQLFSQKTGERQKELTNSIFGTYSGGEKAMSMYVPLFSAVVAKYQGGRADAPKIISLDEAFAGVDNRNIRDMFRLMRLFEFDFIINSQVLWGDCDTMDALAIYELNRPENSKFVTIMPYLWNGKSKEFLKDEAEVEQRGATIEQYA